jgi:hypothetical protein
MAGPRISTLAVIWRTGAAQYSILAATPAPWRRRWPGNRIVSSSPSILPRRCSPWQNSDAGARAYPGCSMTARTARLNRRFDLALLTGHVFQVFLTPDDQAAALTTIATHLALNGCFMFDARSPTAEVWKTWTRDQSQRIIEHPRIGPGRRVKRRVARSSLGRCHVSNLLPDRRRRPGPLLPVANRVSIARTASFTCLRGRFRGRAMDGRLVRSAREPTSSRDHPLGRLR